MDENFFEEIKKMLSNDIFKSIQVFFCWFQDGTIDFLRENRNHMPMYHLPKQKDIKSQWS